MSTTKVAVVSSAVTTVVVLLLVTGVWVGLKALDGYGREVLWSECSGETVSGAEGYCVVVSRYPATPAHSERFRLEIAQLVSGTLNPYRFVGGYPFLESEAGSPLQVDWSAPEERVVVTDPRTGSTITYLADQYVPGR